jgi:magnesium chelatase family protein
MKSGTILGIEGHIVNIQKHLLSTEGDNCTILGLPEAAAKETLLRARQAFSSNEIPWPKGQIRIDLEPTNLLKHGASLDLAIALELATNQNSILNDYMIIGSLSLSGTIQEISGILPLALAAKKAGIKGVIIHPNNASEASLVEDLEILTANTLNKVLEFAYSGEKLPRLERFFYDQPNYEDITLSDEHLRTIEKAIKDRKSILFIGAPESKAIHIAHRIPVLLPDLTPQESLEVTIIHSINGHFHQRELQTTPPFRSPHDTISSEGILGKRHPGEASLAHCGILFLNDVPNFKPEVLRAIQHAYQQGKVTITDRATTFEYPTKFRLIGAMNPCPCGHKDSTVGRICNCSPEIKDSYQKRLDKISNMFDEIIELPNPNNKQNFPRKVRFPGLRPSKPLI